MLEERLQAPIVQTLHQVDEAGGVDCVTAVVLAWLAKMLLGHNTNSSAPQDYQEHCSISR